MPNRVFIPQSALDHGIVAGTVELRDGVLTIVEEGRRYEVEEAVRVLREVSGAGDAGAFVGHVKTRAWLEQQGAEIVETSMLVGDAAYDVEPGWVGRPMGAFAEFLATRGGGKGVAGRASPRSDEELLVRFLGASP